MNDLVAQTALRIAALRGRFITHERYSPLQGRFRLLIEKRLADITVGRTSEAHGIALSGASGTGKSAATAQLLSQTRAYLAGSS